MTRVSTLMAPIATGAIVAVAAACSTSAAGSPRAARAVPESPKPTGPTIAAAPVDELDPCALLSDSDRARLGVRNGEPDKLGNIRSCDWTKSGDFGVAVALHPTRGFQNANLQGSVAASLTIGKHRAHKVENLGGGNGACDIFLEVNASSMAQISATASGLNDTPKACGKAMQVAQIIDPKLP